MIWVEEAFRVVSFYLGLREEFQGSPTSAGTPHFLDSTQHFLTSQAPQLKMAMEQVEVGLP